MSNGPHNKWREGASRTGKLSRSRARTFCQAASLCAVVLLAASAAGAHATLLHTEPLANTRLESAPAKIILIFNERVEPVFNAIRVVDKAGRRVDQGEVRQTDQGDAVEVNLRPLADGPYAVLWRINSADGHQVQGRFGFGVRAPAPAEQDMPGVLPATGTAFWRYYGPSVKWVGMVSLCVWLGGIFFTVVVLRPALNSLSSERDRAALWPKVSRSSATVLLAAGAAYIVSELLALLGQAVSLADVSLSEALTPAVLGVVLGHTNYGQWWGIRMAAALALFALACWRLRPRAEARSAARGSRLMGVFGALLGSVILVSLPLTGHAGAMEHAIVAVASDWLHLAATTVWIGGLVHLALAARSMREDKDAAADLLGAVAGRFSDLAKISVALLLVTGVYAAWLHLPSLASLLTTQYGRALLAKLVVVVPILAIAAVNMMRVVPALRQRSIGADVAGKWAALFPSLLRAETAMAFLLLALVAVLTSLPPANAVAVSGPLSMTRKQGNFTVTLRLDPNRTGRNHAIITLADASGKAVPDARRVTLYVRSLDMDMGLQTVPAEAVSGGQYACDVELSMAGRWQFSVEVSPPEGDAFVTEFKATATL